MPPRSPHRFELILLGGFDVRFGGHPIAGLSYNKMRALLAYLAMEGERDHRREVLAELLWSGNDPATARGNLRRTLSDLRRVLELPTGKVLFSASKHTIRFISDGYIDALDFAGLSPNPDHCLGGGGGLAVEERVIALYRGEFMAGFSLADCPDFENWLQAQRDALHRHALALLEQLSNQHQQTGDYSKALQFALRYTELAPWNEDAHCRAMRLYALKGQSSAAIGQYEACCRLLKSELGTLPNEATRNLAERIRNGELRLEPRTQFSGVLPEPAERRQVTVLYCELTPDSIADPDEALDLLRAPQAQCIKIIQQLSGHIVQTHGGGLLAYFGYPQAYEDAARRAVQAALAITREVGHSIGIRTGIHTGLIISSGGVSMPDSSGSTSKLAIQIHQTAAYNEVLIGQETFGIVSGYFDCISTGVHSLTGVAGPVELYKVLQESGARTRLDAAERLTPLAGREAEIANLMVLWKGAAQGACDSVLIRGEAGIGKSRLLHALKERLAGQVHAVSELRCFPEVSQSPFFPLIAMLEDILGFAPDDTPELRFFKLVACLEEHFPALAQNAIPLLASLLSLPLSGHCRDSGYSPQKQKEQTTLILMDILRELALRQPVLLIVEDLHWIDPSTLELLGAFIGQEPGAGILAVFTARPEFVPPWKKDLKNTLLLAPLGTEAVAKMIASISAEIPASLVRQIVARADGVPLFVEEVAKIATANHRANVPATLHDLLAARMDNLGEAKFTAQLAATIGREFDLNLMRKVSSVAPASLAHSLDALQTAGLTLKVSETVHQFKHALIQEVAYQSQPKVKRQGAHRRIAQSLLSDFSDAAAIRPELLARHFSFAGETLGAIEYWIKAGQRATRNSANTEAIKHFNDGLLLIDKLPHGKERDQLESKLHINLGAVLIATRGYGSSEVGLTYSRALELCEQQGDRDGLYQALWGMWLTSSSRVSHSHSLELAEKLLCQAEQSQDILHLQLAHYALGNSSVITGNLQAARSHLESSMALYKPEHHEIMMSQYGENSCVSSGSLLSTVLWLQGFPLRAKEISRQTVDLARQVNHPNSLGYALCVAAMIRRWMKQVESSGRFAQEAMALSLQHGLPFWFGFGASAYGWVMVMQGQSDGVAQMRQSAVAVNSVMSGSKILFLAPLNDALVHLRQFDCALDELDETLRVVDEKEDHFLESEFHRLKGVCLQEISVSNTDAAEACFGKALAISRMQGAKSLELRAAISMARLWQRQGRENEAHHLLEEVIRWFDKRLETPDIQDARKLLHALG